MLGALCATGWWLRGTPWQAGPGLHTVLEIVATLLALFVGLIALVRYHSKRQNLFLFIGTGFLGAALFDGLHTLATSPLAAGLVPSALSDLTSWNWLAARLFLALFLALSWWFYRQELRLGPEALIPARGVYAFIAALAVLVVLLFVLVKLPPAYTSALFFSRPQEFFAAALFLVPLVGFLFEMRVQHERFLFWVKPFLVLSIALHAGFMSVSQALFDVPFVAAHGLKVMSYALILTGLIVSTSDLFQQAEQHAETLRRTLEALKRIELRFTKIFSLSAIGKAILAPDGRFSEVNPAFCAFVGYEADELLEMGFRDLTHPDDQARSEEALRHLMTGAVASLSVEKRYLHKQGHTV